MNCLGQGRSDIQLAAEQLGKEVPSWTKLKRFLRYLNGHPRAILHIGIQEKEEAMVAWTDSDFAGCENSRKST